MLFWWKCRRPFWNMDFIYFPHNNHFGNFFYLDPCKNPKLDYKTYSSGIEKIQFGACVATYGCFSVFLWKLAIRACPSVSFGLRPHETEGHYVGSGGRRPQKQSSGLFLASLRATMLRRQRVPLTLIPPLHFVTLRNAFGALPSAHARKFYSL